MAKTGKGMMTILIKYARLDLEIIKNQISELIKELDEEKEQKEIMEMRE